MKAHGTAAARQNKSLSAAPARLLQRQCACGQRTYCTEQCDNCRQQGTLQRQPAGGALATDLGAAAPPIVHDVLRSPGQELDPGTRETMEARFQHDFSGVRVHADGRAARSAQAVNANAYTVGQDVVFDAGRFAPKTHEGQRLIAHELTHVVQQSGSQANSLGQITLGDDAAQERQAGDAASRVAGGSDVSAQSFAGTGLRVAREPATPYKTPYSEELAQELMRRVLEARRSAPSATRPATKAEIAAGATPGAQVASIARESRRTFAVAAVYDTQGNRIDTIVRFFDEQLSGGLHAEEQIVAAVRDMMARGEKVGYTIMLVDQDPCEGCVSALEEFINDPATGTFRTVTPKATWKNDPTRETTAKTGYRRAVAADETMSSIRLNPSDPAAGEAFVKTRPNASKVRLPMYRERPPVPAPTVQPSAVAPTTAKPTAVPSTSVEPPATSATPPPPRVSKSILPKR